MANAVCIWLKTAKAELVKDTVFLKLLTVLQDSLQKDALLPQLTDLTSSLADSIKNSKVSGGASSPIMPHSHTGNSLPSFLKVICSTVEPQATSLICPKVSRIEGSFSILTHSDYIIQITSLSTVVLYLTPSPWP